MASKLFYGVLCLLLFAGCGKDSELGKDDPQEGPSEKKITLELLAADLVFEDSGGVKTFSIVCNGEWKIEKNGNWCIAGAEAGNGNCAVNVTVGAYEGVDDRSTTLTVKAGELSRTVNVTQKRKDAIVLAKNRWEISSDGGTVSVEVKSNIGYEVTIPEKFRSWISLSPDSKALESKTYRFTVGENEDTEERTGYIVFSGGALKDTVYVVQAQKNAIILGQGRLEVPQGGGTVSVEVKSNIDYEVTIPEKFRSWISLSPDSKALESKTYRFTIGENEDTEERTGYIVFSGGTLKDTVYVVQAQKETIILGEDRFYCERFRCMVSVEVRSNIDYEVTIPEKFRSWISLSPDSKESKYWFTIEKNGNPEMRTGYIVFSGGTLKDTAYIVQRPRAVFILDKDRFDVPQSGGTVSVKCKFNSEWEAIACEDWIHGNYRGRILEDGQEWEDWTISFTIEENKDAEVRTGIVIFYSDRCGTYPELGFKDTIYFVQAPKRDIGEDKWEVPQSGGRKGYVLGSDRALKVSTPPWISCSISASPPVYWDYDCVAEANMDSEIRSGSIVLSDSLGPKYIINVFQNGISPQSDFTATAAGQSFDMVYVQGGTFQMGATEEQHSIWNIDDEKPVHSVTLSDYYIGKHEVTQGLWKAVMGTSVEEQRWEANMPSLYGEGDSYPMYYVSWNEAQKFVEKLSELTGKKFVLPTEAQWEYAARGGAKSKGYTWSGGNGYDWAWIPDNSSGTTHPVGTKLPNELGIYDMSGNVWEWCSDWKGEYRYKPLTNPTGPESGTYRVYRGGSFYESDRFSSRVSCRRGAVPGCRFFYLGFRVALVP